MGHIWIEMDHAFWLERWRENQVGFHLGQVNPRLVQWASALPPANLRASPSRVLVPLCGKSLDLGWLAARGHHVVGVELSPIAVRAFFEERGTQPEIDRLLAFERYRSGELELLCGDFFDLDRAALGACHGLYDRAALVALPEPMRDRYVSHVAGLLTQGARGLLVTFDYPQSQMSGPPFSLPDSEVRARYAKHFELESLASYDILEQEPHFRRRGLTQLHERVYALVRR
jgi:thiopurine S-methyltransferase